MRSVTVFIILASIAKAQSQLQAQQSFAKSGNRQLVRNLASRAWANPQSPRVQANLARSPSPAELRFPGLPQEERSRWSMIAAAEASGEPAVAEVAEAPVPAEPEFWSKENIYAEATEACASGKPKEEQCTYEPDSPKVCVDVKEFDPPLAFGIKRLGPVGPRCVTIWAIGNKPLARGQYDIQGDYDMKCSALPTNILTSAYTVDEWNKCDLFTKEYRGDPLVKFTSEEKIYQEKEMSGRCFRFRKAINKICNICSTQATSNEAKAALEKKCAALDGAATSLADEEPRGPATLSGGPLILLAAICFAGVGLSRKWFLAGAQEQRSREPYQLLAA